LLQEEKEVVYSEPNMSYLDVGTWILVTFLVTEQKKSLLNIFTKYIGRDIR
jgi:hypothetical protein